ncbi:MAG TPA: nucleotidyltransferase domain-containing protein [Candidatus Saccharimonadales bacterium]|nr:nucleotidyltransferase domain-containing protein [Candidatus Saccharimonadales bacterium]
MNKLSNDVVKNICEYLPFDDLENFIQSSPLIYTLCHDLYQLRIFKEKMKINENLITIFEQLSDYYRWEGDKFRAGAFDKSAEALSNYNIPITDINTFKKVKIENIGKSSLDIIDEYLKTGQVKRLNELKMKYQDKINVLTFFTSFYGIGIKEATKFYDRGCRTLNDLWHKASLNESQRLGILWRKHLVLKINREEMDRIYLAINSIFIKHINMIEWMMVGSYRRQCPQSSDVDVLIKRTPLSMTMDTIVDLLKSVLVAILAKGHSKLMGIMRLSPHDVAHRIDIRIIDEPSWPYGLLYFTGSKNFNQYSRKRAIELGMTLNEYGLYQGYDETSLFAKTERDIFKHLQLDYLDPKDRI